MTATRQHFPVGVSAEMLALAWARQGSAPAGSVVVVDTEISPRGRLGRLWDRPQGRTATVAVVWRPVLPAGAADLVWAAASVTLRSAAAVLAPSGTALLWWPDSLVDSEGMVTGEVRAETQLGPGRVVSSVVTARLDLAALGGVSRDAAVDALATALQDGGALLDQPAELATSYAEVSVLVGKRVTARLLPRGALRGRVRGIDDHGRLELVSSTGLVERVPVVGVDRLEVSSSGPS